MRFYPSIYEVLEYLPNVVIAGVIIGSLFYLLFWKYRSFSIKQLFFLWLYWGGSFAIIHFLSCILTTYTGIHWMKFLICLVPTIGIPILFKQFGLKSAKPNGIDQFPVFLKKE